MADEAVLVIELQPPIPFSVANDIGIEKGSVLKLSGTDSMTAAIADGDGDLVAGIAASEKISGDGKLRLGVFRKGIFKVTVSGSCIAGDALETDVSPNHVGQFDASVSGTRIIGTALEDGSSSGTIMMDLNPTAGAVA